MISIVRPTFPDLSEFSEEFSECLKSGKVTNHGRWVQAFESALTDYLGCPTICFVNGHTALMAMLAASDVRGGEVIVPAFTFVSSIQAIEWAGANPVFCDIKPDTLCIDWDDATERMKGGLVAIMPVAPYGIIPSLISPHYLPCLIDAAPAFGSTKNGKPYAGEGTAMMFSFHATKPFGIGEGAAICSHDPEFLDKCRRIRNFGQDNGDVVECGLNGKMQEVNALIGLKQLAKWPQRYGARIMNCWRFREAISGIEGVTAIEPPLGQSPVWTYYPILIDEKKFGMSRDDVIYGFERYSIYARKYYTACHKLSRYRHMNVSLPVTERIAEQVIALPVYNDYADGEIARIATVLSSLQRNEPIQQRSYVGRLMQA